jgi:pimeloyl-ACP methyl ester carboxylesterase
VAGILTLAKWLGPWADEQARPNLPPEVIEIPAHGERPAFEAWAYEPPGKRRGTYLIAPGLHYAGPEDPRMDRFCRILAAAGYEVVCPFLPDYTELTVRETAIEDFGRFVDRYKGRQPAIFAISFGSLLALRAAAHEERRDFVQRVLLFGGYADFRGVVEFALSGAEGRPHDPLNAPVVVLNCLPWIDHAVADPGPVIAAWDRYVRATWGRPEMKEGGAWRSVARAEAEGLAGPALELFELGTGLRPGALEACLAAIDRSGAGLAHVDPRPHLSGLRAPVHVLHGAEDDVIPFEQAALIEAALPAGVDRRVYLTGLYGHTTGEGLNLRRVRESAREIATLLGMLRAIAG